MMGPNMLANFSKVGYEKSFAELYEHSPWVIESVFETVKADEKYNDINKFHELLSETMLKADKKLQDKLIKAHPMLAGKLAQNGELTDFSTDEQASAGLNHCTQEEIALFDELNKKYFEKFKFPYILAVKGKRKQEIIENFKERLNNDYETERKTALDQINKIAFIRIRGIYVN